MSELTEQQKKDLRGFRYGCMNCLWASSECIDMSGFVRGPIEKVKSSGKEIVTCQAYSYYD